MDEYIEFIILNYIIDSFKSSYINNTLEQYLITYFLSVLDSPVERCIEKIISHNIIDTLEKYNSEFLDIIDTIVYPPKGLVIDSHNICYRVLKENIPIYNNLIKRYKNNIDPYKFNKKSYISYLLNNKDEGSQYNLYILDKIFDVSIYYNFNETKRLLLTIVDVIDDEQYLIFIFNRYIDRLFSVKYDPRPAYFLNSYNTLHHNRYNLIKKLLTRDVMYRIQCIASQKLFYDFYDETIRIFNYEACKSLKTLMKMCKEFNSSYD
jgi:hypothetical protein